MPKRATDREHQDLLADYADALRDGRVPGFLRTLTRREGRAVSDSDDLAQATEMVRVLNQAAFADKAMWPDMGLFISRVDAKIASRLQHSKAHVSGRHVKGAGSSADRSEDAVKRL
jgi:hypothetical protein